MEEADDDLFLLGRMTEIHLKSMFEQFAGRCLSCFASIRAHGNNGDVLLCKCQMSYWKISHQTGKTNTPKQQKVFKEKSSI